VFEADRPLVFAHRGGAKLAPEHTMAAFANGLAHGSDGLEVDVHLSRDGVPVIMHDPTVDRTTDGHGPIASFTVAELARLDAGARFGGEQGFPFRGRGHGVPTLESVLAAWPSTRVIIEMKFGTPALAEAVVAVVRRHQATSRVCLGSFQQVALHTARTLAPEIATGASHSEARRTLWRSWVHWPVSPRALPYDAYQIPVRFGRMRVASASFLRQARRAGRSVQVWVVDAEDVAQRLLDWGADGLVTDRPDLIVPLRDRWVAGGRSISHQDFA
jgi:glycerophosphoryl diester phosphodiesterase